MFSTIGTYEVLIFYKRDFFKYQLGGGGSELYACPYPPKVQTCPPRDQRLTFRSRVPGQEEVCINDHLSIYSVSANHLEGVETRVSFSPDGKMALTVHIRRMLCTVDVRGSLMMFV